MAKPPKTSPQDGPPEPAELDLGTLALFVGQACAEAVQRDLARLGFGDVRFSHGYLFQHLVSAEGRAITELARRLGVSQQAASKSIAEVERLGYVEMVRDPTDARRRIVRLTRRGRAVIMAARRARLRLERTLTREHGARALAGCKATLAAILDGLGGTEAVRQRRIRAPR